MQNLRPLATPPQLSVPVQVPVVQSGFALQSCVQLALTPPSVARLMHV
jgi:hypothetical protein